eukprot:828035-Pelagomonas_calceolata.AAC.4
MPSTHIHTPAALVWSAWECPGAESPGRCPRLWLPPPPLADHLCCWLQQQRLPPLRGGNPQAAWALGARGHACSAARAGTGRCPSCAGAGSVQRRTVKGGAACIKIVVHCFSKTGLVKSLPPCSCYHSK